MRTVLVCVRTPLAAQSVASCAARLGVSTLRTAVSETEVLARLADQPAHLILADTAVTRPDTVGFTRRVLAQAPRAVLVLFGAEEPNVAAAAVAAGARGLIRGGDHDLVGTVAKAVLLIGSARSGAATAPANHAANSAASNGAGQGASSGANGTNTGAGTATTNGVVSGAAVAAGNPVRAVSAVTPERRNAPGTAAGATDAGDGTEPATLVPAQRGDAVAPPGRRRGMRSPLTERELQVLRGMAEGRSNAEIGRELYVSEDTVKTHARRLFRKLGARDRAHAVAVGFRTGVLG